MVDGTTWIEITKPINLPEPPEGLPKGFTNTGHRCEVPVFVAKRLIEAGEAIEVDGPHGEGEPEPELIEAGEAIEDGQAQGKRGRKR